MTALLMLFAMIALVMAAAAVRRFRMTLRSGRGNRRSRRAGAEPGGAPLVAATGCGSPLGMAIGTVTAMLAGGDAQPLFGVSAADTVPTGVLLISPRRRAPTSSAGAPALAVDP